jgi:hypothetical protein
MTMRSRAALPRGAMAAVLALAVAVGGAACSSEASPAPSSSSRPPAAARPTSTARLSIVSPRNGEALAGPAVPLKVSLEGATITAATSTNLRPDEGHLHVILDDRLVSMTSGLRENIPDVKPGPHLLRVEFVASDHAPFDPRVVQQVAFEVRR